MVTASRRVNIWIVASQAGVQRSTVLDKVFGAVRYGSFKVFRRKCRTVVAMGVIDNGASGRGAWNKEGSNLSKGDV